MSDVNTTSAALPAQSPEAQALIAQFVRLHRDIERCWADIKTAQTHGNNRAIGAARRARKQAEISLDSVTWQLSMVHGRAALLAAHDALKAVRHGS